MVTDAVWADLTGDGKDELILVGEWMGIQIYQQQTSETGLPVFVQIQDQLGFSQSVGFWQSVHSFDVNGDSRPDLLTGNLGLNTILTPDKSRDLYLHIHDFTQNGVPSSVMTESDGKGEYVLDPLDELLAEYSFLAQRIESYQSFANTSFQALFPIHKDQFYQKIQLNEVRSGIWLSQPDGTYLFEPLPLLAQITSIRDWILLENSESISAQSSARNERSSQDQKNFSVLASGNLPFVRPSISAPQRGVALFHLQIETTQYSSQNGSHDNIQEQLISEIKVIEPGKALSSVKGVISNLSTIELEKGSYVLIGRNSETPLLLSRN